MIIVTNNNHKKIVKEMAKTKNEVKVTVEEKKLALTEEQLMRSIDAIKKALASVEKGYLTIAPHVAKIADSEAYKELQFKNIYDFCDDTFGMSRGTVHNLRTVVKRFYENYKMKEEFKGYSLRKLLLITKLTDAQIEEYSINEHMSENEIRGIVEKLLENNTSSKIEEKVEAQKVEDESVNESVEAETESDSEDTFTIKFDRNDIDKEALINKIVLLSKDTEIKRVNILFN